MQFKLYHWRLLRGYLSARHAASSGFGWSRRPPRYGG